MPPRPSSPTLLAFLLGTVSGCASESNATTPSDSCTEQIDRFATRVAECRTLTSEQREAAIARCESAASAADPRDAWRQEFQKAVDDCSETLTCEDFAENLDDICYPEALAAGASGLLAEATIATCVSGGTEDCEQELALGRETGTSVVSRCLRRWAECAAEREQSDPYWTEDHCGTLIALTDSHRTQAETCIDLACTEVAGCLVTAGAFNF